MKPVNLRSSTLEELTPLVYPQKSSHCELFNLPLIYRFKIKIDLSKLYFLI